MTLEIQATFALPSLIKANNLSHTTEKKSTKINSVVLSWIIALIFDFLVSLISLLLLKPASNATTQNKIILWCTSNDFFENRWFDGKCAKKRCSQVPIHRLSFALDLCSIPQVWVFVHWLSGRSRVWTPPFLSYYILLIFIKFYASNFLSCISCVILLFKNRFVSCRVFMLDQMKAKEQFLNDKVHV